MRKFLEYVNENSERFGAVIDGLNIAYLCKRRKEVAFETVSLIVIFLRKPSNTQESILLTV